MIKVDLAKASWGGPKAIIKAELCTLLHALIQREVLTPDEIDACVVDAKKTEDEIAKEIASIRKEASPESVALADMATKFVEMLMDLDD